MQTPVCRLSHLDLPNDVFIKRDDLYPFSFGGNKARKAELFWEDVEALKADYIVTYGSSSSNHCRVIANLAARNGIPCLLIAPQEKSEKTFNRDMTGLFGADVLPVPVEHVKDTIDCTLEKLREDGYSPYFIMGGGHGNLGTQAYVNVYEEIRRYEEEKGWKFDRIFHASGTGTTQAGLICGQLLSGEHARRITGISIARRNPYGRDVVVQSVKDYLKEQGKDTLYEDKYVEFVDDYTEDGYGSGSPAIDAWIRRMLIHEGIPLDETYTGKAFAGMCDYLEKNRVIGQKILFIHTGGTPLFFDYLMKRDYDECTGAELRNEK